MTHEEADSGHVNPHAREKGGTENCQMCAVVYEGRLRGYNFIAKVYNDSNKYMRRLSYDMSLAFIDPITKKHPEFTYMPETIHRAEDYAVFLNQKIRENERYTLDFNWDGLKEGHVVNAWREQENMTKLSPLILGMASKFFMYGEVLRKEQGLARRNIFYKKEKSFDLLICLS